METGGENMKLALAGTGVGLLSALCSLGEGMNRAHLHGLKGKEAKA